MKHRIIFSLVLFIFIFFGCGEKNSNKNTSFKQSSLSDQALITKWKKETTTIKIIESNTNFGWAVNTNDNLWKYFKSKIKVGDEIWSYCSPPITWDNFLGSQGYAIFRNGKLVEEYETLCN